MKRTQQAGMTLIELVIVIIVLGIIAAVAAPKFADISGKAVTASNEGTIGAIDSAYTIAIAKASGTPDVDGFVAQVSNMTCDSVICASANKDGVAGADITVAFFKEVTGTTACAAGNATSAGADKVTGYGFYYNAETVTDITTANCRIF